MTALEHLIADHRAAYQADLRIDRLVARQPPTTLDLNTGQLHVEPGAATGMPMSGRLLRRLGHPEGFGSDFPWTKAWWSLKHECRRRHLGHTALERPYWRGSLCWMAVKLTVIGGESKGEGPMGVERAAGILKVDDLEPVLRRAFRTIEETLDDYRAKAEKRAREDEGHGPGAIIREEPPHHGVPGLHQTECPQCRAA